MTRKSVRLVFLFFLLSGVVRGQSSYSSPDTGHKVLGTYFATDVDDVNMKNGNLHVSIPLFTLPGRELPLTVSMEYDSQLYEYRVIWNPPSDPVEYYEFLGWRKKTGVGGLLNAAKSLGIPYSKGNWYQDVALTFTWIEWDGTKHDFAKTLTRFCVYGGYGWCDTPSIPDSEIYDNHTIDSGASEFLRLSTGTHFSSASQPAKVFFKDGRSVNITARSANTRNGNFLAGNASTQTVTVVSGGQGGTGLADYLPTTDTTGRSIGWSDNGTTQTITMTDVNGQPKIYRINWTTLTLNYTHPCFTMNNNAFKVVTSIELPNGKTYTLDYDTTGYLSKLTFPSGAYIKYS